MMSLYEEADDISTVSSMAHVQINNDASNTADLLTQAHGTVRSVLRHCFSDIYQSIENDPNKALKLQIMKIETRTKSEVENCFQNATGIPHPSTAKQQLDIVKIKGGDMPRPPPDILNGCSSHFTDPSAQTPRLLVVATSTKHSHSKHTENRINCSKIPHTSPAKTSSNSQHHAIRNAYEDMSSFEIFGHISQRMEQRDCGWEGLLEELTAGQDIEVQQRIREDLLSKNFQSDAPEQKEIYEVLILWKLYTKSAHERSKRLRRALDALGMSDLADELPLSFNAQHHI